MEGKKISVNHQLPVFIKVKKYVDTFYLLITLSYTSRKQKDPLLVSHPGKGGCADPVNEDAILERVGGRPPAGIGSVS
jgi:hypothetical protein